MCNSVKAVSAPAPVVASQSVAGLFFAPGDKKSPAQPVAPVKVEPYLSTGQRIVNYVQAVIAAKGLDINKWVFNGKPSYKYISGTYEAAINSVLNSYSSDCDATLFNVSVPALAKFIGVEPQYLYDIGNKKINPPTPVPAKVEPIKLKTRILPGGIKRYVHVFAPALKERFEGKVKDNPLCCVRVGSNPKRFKMYRGVEFLSGASLEELAEPLAGTNGRAICVMVTTGPIRVSY